MSGGHHRPLGIASRVFRLSLLLLPKGFRAEYGREIWDFHLARMDDEGTTAASRSRLWFFAVLDVLFGGFLERIRRAIPAERKTVSGPSSSATPPPGRPNRVIEPGRVGLGLRIDVLFQDIRFATRSLLRHPGYSSVAALSLAVGIGLIGGSFSVLHETILKPVPGITGGDRIVEIPTQTSSSNFSYWTYPDFIDVRALETPFLELTGWKPRMGTLATVGENEPVRFMSVSANYFRTLGVVPFLGRFFLPDEDVNPGQNSIAVVSHRTWLDRLGGDPAVVGRRVTLNEAPYTVVGVAPPGFLGHRADGTGPELWVPLSQDQFVAESPEIARDREARWLQVLGRLRDDTTLEGANAALQAIFTRLEEEYPKENEGRRARAYSFQKVPPEGRAGSIQGAALIGGLVGMILVIICANVAGMILARTVTREKELSARIALGSGRGRLVQLILAEAFTLVLAAGIGGTLLAKWGLKWAQLLFPDAPVMASGNILVVLLPIALSVVGTALLIGIPASITFSQSGLASCLCNRSAGNGRKVGKVHRLGASAQTGVALALVVSASLFVRAVGFLGQRDLGFDPAGVLVTRMNLARQGFESPEAGRAFLDRAKATLASVPGVESVALSDGLPVDLVGNFTRISRADLPEDNTLETRVEFTCVGEDFFETIGTQILRGRGIMETDEAGSEKVMVITESLSARLWPGEDPIGARVREGGDEITVVGVVPDVASSRPTENWPQIFLSIRQYLYPEVLILAKGPPETDGLYRPIRDAILSLDPEMSIPPVVSSESLLHRASSSQRATAKAAGALGMLALLLSGIGVYGVVALSVSSRTREIGVRMALGASKRGVLRETLGNGVRISAPGLLFGFLLSSGLATLFRAQLFGLSPVDPRSYLASASILLIVILLGSIIPARRASSVDPLTALRQD